MSEERDADLELADADDPSILDDLLEPELDEEIAAEDDELPEETTEEDEPPPQPRRPSARQRAAIRLRKRLEETEEENRRLRELALTQTRPPAPAQPDPYRQMELDRQEAERVAQMMPHEAAAYEARKVEQRMNYQLQSAELRVADMLDKQAFGRLQEQEPMARKLAGQIERALAASRQGGMNPTREALYNQLFAQEVRAKAKTQAEKQRQQGRRRIAAQTTQPGGSRSTATATRGRRDDNSFEALEARLKGATLKDAWS